MINDEAHDKFFALGFMASREGYNAECPICLAPERLFDYRGFQSYKEGLDRLLDDEAFMALFAEAKEVVREAHTSDRRKEVAPRFRFQDGNGG